MLVYVPTETSMEGQFVQLGVGGIFVLLVLDRVAKIVGYKKNGNGASEVKGILSQVKNSNLKLDAVLHELTMFNQIHGMALSNMAEDIKEHRREMREVSSRG